MSAGVPGTKYQGCYNTSERKIYEKQYNILHSKLLNVEVHLLGCCSTEGGGGVPSKYTVPAVVSQTVISSAFLWLLQQALGPRLNTLALTLPTFVMQTEDASSPLLTQELLVQPPCVTKAKGTLAACSILLWKLFVKTSFHNSLNATSVEAYNTDVSCFSAILARLCPLCFGYTHWSPLSSN
jgi:hypothetical protein